MYSLEPTKIIEKQFKRMEDKAKRGALGKRNIELLAKICHCFFHLSDNPSHPSLNTSPYSDKDFNKILKKVAGKEVKCYHSYIENESPSARRIYWYYDSGSSIRLIGIARHPKKGSERDKPKFKDLAEENLSESYKEGYIDGYNSVKE